MKNSFNIILYYQRGGVGTLKSKGLRVNLINFVQKLIC